MLVLERPPPNLRTMWASGTMQYLVSMWKFPKSLARDLSRIYIFDLKNELKDWRGNSAKAFWFRKWNQFRKLIVSRTSKFFPNIGINTSSLSSDHIFHVCGKNLISHLSLASHITQDPILVFLSVTLGPLRNISLPINRKADEPKDGVVLFIVLCKWYMLNEPSLWNVVIRKIIPVFCQSL